MSLRELRANGIGVTIGDRAVLNDVNMVAPAGQWLTITGPSGSGKSTLLHVLAGLRQPQRGEVLIDGQPAWTGPTRQRPPGIVLQAYGLVPILTTSETTSLPLQARRVPKATVVEESRHWLHALGLTHVADQQVSDLSGGQRQRVALARALAAGSPLLFLDEPTAELDASNRDGVLLLLRQRAEENSVLIVVSHDPAILDISDSILDLTSNERLSEL